MLFLRADHTLPSRPCLAEKVFFLGHPRNDSNWISFLRLLTQSLMEVFSCPQATSSPQVGLLAQHIHRFGPLGLSPPQITISVLRKHEACFLSNHTYKNKEKKTQNRDLKDKKEKKKKKKKEKEKTCI